MWGGQHTPLLYMWMGLPLALVSIEKMLPVLESAKALIERHP